MISFEDDASRFITGFGIFSHATSQHSADVFQQAINSYMLPKQVMSDHGTKFVSVTKPTGSNPEPTLFQKILDPYQVQHVKARVKHPQSNGKMERFKGAMKRLYPHFNDWIQTLSYYNFERSHMSLQTERCEAPFQAYIRKFHHKHKENFINTHQELIQTWAPEYSKGM